MKSEWNTKDAKEFVTDRVMHKKNIKEKYRENIYEMVSKLIDVDEEFLDLPYSYTDEQEWDYIHEKTGYNYDFIRLLLWERYCYEMDIGLWEYDNDICLNCKKGPLLFKEIPNVNHTEKLICENCGCDMQIGENGVEPLEI